MTRTKKALIFVLSVICIICLSAFAFTACGTKKPARLSLTTKEVKTSYVKGEALDLTGLKVAAVYEGKDDVILTEDEYTVTPANGTVLNEDTTVTVAYAKDESIKADFKVKVHNNVESVTVKTAPEKTVYWAEEAFDATGMILTVTYEDKSTKDVTVSEEASVSYSKEPFKTTTATDDKDETQEITFTYLGKTVTQEVTVKYNPVTSLVIKTQPTTLSYFKGEVFNPAGLVLTATYKSEMTVDVTVASDARAIYKTTALRAEDTTLTVTFGELSVNVELTILKGIFIEAEMGDIASSTVDINTNSVRKATEEEIEQGLYVEENGIKIAADENGNKINSASGGKYIGDMKAGDTVDFIFDSDGAGTISMSFRMASQYLKEDKSWTPIWMGDCQFNKICEVYVNGVLCPVPDATVLPGGGSKGGSADATLWYNWQEVLVENVAVKEGRNSIQLKFIKHNYTDTSQSSFSGAFTANIDSLIVDPGDTGLEFTPYAFELTTTDIDNSIIEIRNVDGKPVYVIGKGSFEYSYTGNYTEEEVAAKFASTLTSTLKNIYHFDLQTNDNIVGGGWNRLLSDGYSALVLSDDGGVGEYAISVDISSLAVRGYTTHFGKGGSSSAPVDFKPGVAMSKVVGIGNRKYLLTCIPGSGNGSEYWGCVGIQVFELTVTAYPEDLNDAEYTGLTVKLNDSKTDTPNLEAGKYTVSKDGNIVTITVTETFGEGDGEYTATYTVSYTTAPTSLTVKEYPTDITATDYTGLVVTAGYVNGATEDVELADLTVTEEDGIVTVEYQGVTATYSKLPTLTVKTYPTDIKDVTAFTGLTVDATYVNGHKVEDIAVADLSITEEDGTVTVAYGGAEVTYSTLATGIKVLTLPADLSDAEFTGLTVEVTYVNGQKVTLTAAEVKDNIEVDPDTHIATITVDGKTARFHTAPAAAPEANWVGDSFFTDSAWGTNTGYVKPTVDTENKKVTVAAGTAVRNEGFFNVSKRDGEGNVIEGTVNIGHTSTTAADGVFGVEHVWTMNVKANGAWGMMLFATNGVGTTPSNAYSAYYVDYADGYFTMRGSGVSDGRILAKSLLTDFSEEEVNVVTLSVTREDAGNILFKLFVNGKQVYFEATSNNNGGTVVDGGYRFASRGHGPRLNFVAGANTTVEITVSAQAAAPEVPEETPEA